MIQCGITLYIMRDRAATVHKHLSIHTTNVIMLTEDDKKSISLGDSTVSNALARVSQREMSTKNSLGQMKENVIGLRNS